MSDDTKPSQLAYVKLLYEEQQKLEVIEDKVVKLLVTSLGVAGGGRWEAFDIGHHRMIRLIAPERKTPTVFEISDMDLAEISSSDLMSDISHTIRQI